MRDTIRTIFSVAIGAAGASASFVLMTVNMDQVPDGVLIAVALVGAFAIACAGQGLRGIDGTAGDRGELLRAAGAGIVAFWGAPLLALSQRATDSPSGSDAVMLTTAAWGALAVLAVFVAGKWRPPYSVPAAALAMLFGAAAILANWERPSSLNLFVKASGREAVIVLAGVAFAIAAVFLARSISRFGVRRTSVVSTGAALAVAALYAVPSIPASLPVLSRLSVSLTLLGLAYGAFCVAWLETTSKRGVQVASVSLLLVPATLTLLTVVERAFGVFGPNPLVWPGILAGAALCVGGAIVLLVADECVDLGGARPRLFRVAVALGFAALVLAVIALVNPALRATSEGSLGEGFHATWAMLGFETAAGWMPLVASTLALAALLDGPGRRNRATAIAASLLALATAFTTFPLADVPLHTWTTWIPADVQQTYGTEYARFSTEPLVSPVAIGSLLLACVTAVIALLLALKPSSGDHDQDQK